MTILQFGEYFFTDANTANIDLIRFYLQKVGLRLNATETPKAVTHHLAVRLKWFFSNKTDVETSVIRTNMKDNLEIDEVTAVLFYTFLVSIDKKQFKTVSSVINSWRGVLATYEQSKEVKMYYSAKKDDIVFDRNGIDLRTGEGI